MNAMSTLAENLEKLFPKAPNKYSMNTAIICYEHMIQGGHFNLACFQKLSSNYLKGNSVFKSSWPGQSIIALSKRQSKIFIQTYQ